MAKHPKPEEIIAKLRQADVLISQGQSVSDAIRAIGVSSVAGPRPPTPEAVASGRDTVSFDPAYRSLTPERPLRR